MHAVSVVLAGWQESFIPAVKAIDLLSELQEIQEQ